MFSCEPGCTLCMCALCTTKALEAHHAPTCKKGSDVIARQFASTFQESFVQPYVEAGSGLVMTRNNLDL